MVKTKQELKQDIEDAQRRLGQIESGQVFIRSKAERRELEQVGREEFLKRRIEQQRMNVEGLKKQFESGEFRETRDRQEEQRQEAVIERNIERLKKGEIKTVEAQREIRQVAEQRAAQEERRIMAQAQTQQEETERLFQRKFQGEELTNEEQARLTRGLEERQRVAAQLRQVREKFGTGEFRKDVETKTAESISRPQGALLPEQQVEQKQVIVERAKPKTLNEQLREVFGKGKQTFIKEGKKAAQEAFPASRLGSAFEGIAQIRKKTLEEVAQEEGIASLASGGVLLKSGEVARKIDGVVVIGKDTKRELTPLEELQRRTTKVEGTNITTGQAEQEFLIQSIEDNQLTFQKMPDKMEIIEFQPTREGDLTSTTVFGKGILKVRNLGIKLGEKTEKFFEKTGFATEESILKKSEKIGLSGLPVMVSVGLVQGIRGVAQFPSFLIKEGAEVIGTEKTFGEVVVETGKGIGTGLVKKPIETAVELFVFGKVAGGIKGLATTGKGIVIESLAERFGRVSKAAEKKVIKQPSFVTVQEPKTLIEAPTTTAKLFEFLDKPVKETKTTPKKAFDVQTLTSESVRTSLQDISTKEGTIVQIESIEMLKNVFTGQPTGKVLIKGKAATIGTTAQGQLFATRVSFETIGRLDKKLSKELFEGITEKKAGVEPIGKITITQGGKTVVKDITPELQQQINIEFAKGQIGRTKVFGQIQEFKLDVQGKPLFEGEAKSFIAESTTFKLPKLRDIKVVDLEQTVGGKSATLSSSILKELKQLPEKEEVIKESGVLNVFGKGQKIKGTDITATPSKAGKINVLDSFGREFGTEKLLTLGKTLKDTSKENLQKGTKQVSKSKNISKLVSLPKASSYAKLLKGKVDTVKISDYRDLFGSLEKVGLEKKGLKIEGTIGKIKTVSIDEGQKQREQVLSKQRAISREKSFIKAKQREKQEEKERFKFKEKELEKSKLDTFAIITPKEEFKIIQIPQGKQIQREQQKIREEIKQPTKITEKIKIDVPTQQRDIPFGKLPSIPKIPKIQPTRREPPIEPPKLPLPEFEFESSRRATTGKGKAKKPLKRVVSLDVLAFDLKAPKAYKPPKVFTGLESRFAV